LAENKTEIKDLGKRITKFTSCISVQIKNDPNLSYIEAYLATALKPFTLIKYQLFISEKMNIKRKLSAENRLLITPELRTKQ
jgi:hypothetical protein